MNFKHVALVAASVFSVSALAAPKDVTFVKNASNQVFNGADVKADFGHYVVQRGLKLVPTFVADQSQSLGNVAGQSVVKAEGETSLVTKGTLVKSLFTGELVPLSGRINVLLNDGVSARDLANRFGASVVSEFASSGVVVLEVAEGQDLLELKKALAGSQEVREARIEVLEVLHKET